MAVPFSIKEQGRLLELDTAAFFLHLLELRRTAFLSPIWPAGFTLDWRKGLPIWRFPGRGAAARAAAHAKAKSAFLLRAGPVADCCTVYLLLFCRCPADRGYGRHSEQHPELYGGLSWHTFCTAKPTA